jgi:hypothetical protein
MKQNSIDSANGVFGLGTIAGFDDDGIATDSDGCSLADNVKRGSFAVLGKEPNGITFGFSLLSHFFGQANGCERTLFAESGVLGDGWTFDRLTQTAGVRDRCSQVGASCVIDWYSDRDVGRVVADASFRNGLAERVFQQDGVGNELKSIGGPGFRSIVFAASRFAAFVFVRQVRAIATTEAIDFTEESQSLAGQLNRDGIAFLVGFQGRVEVPTSINAMIGNANLFNFFEVE